MGADVPDIGSRSLRQGGRDEAALWAIEQALTICERPVSAGPWPKSLRTKAPLLVSTGRGKQGEIETILLDSLEIAKHQQARCWELRTSCDLSRLWQSQGRNRKLEICCSRCTINSQRVLMQPICTMRARFCEAWDDSVLKISHDHMYQLKLDLTADAWLSDRI